MDAGKSPPFRRIDEPSQFADEDEPPPIPDDDSRPFLADETNGLAQDETPPLPQLDVPPPIPGELDSGIASSKRRDGGSAIGRGPRDIVFIRPRSDQQTRDATQRRLNPIAGHQTFAQLVGPKPPKAPPGTTLSRVALGFCLLAIPVAVAAVFIPPLWLVVLFCSVMARALGGYVRRQGGPAEKLATLAVQFGRGFLFIAIVALTLILTAVLLFGFGLFGQALATWKESNWIANRTITQVENVEGFVSGFFRHKTEAPTNSSPSPSPASTP